MACPLEDLAMEGGQEKQTAGPEEASADRPETPPPPPYSGSETPPLPNPAKFYRMIGVGGMHGDWTGTTRPRLFPESLYFFVHDGALHSYLASSFCVRIWLLLGAYLCISTPFLLPLAPVVVCCRAVYLVYHGRLAELGYLPWYAQFLPLAFLYMCLYELVLYLNWQQRRQVDTQNFGPRYRFPVLYLFLRTTEHHLIRLLPASLIRSLYSQIEIPKE
ncbi:hypothetical protein MY5147_003838 [Beauveria neobassiana]|uniref:Uncharacterized protein n=2 Tax=Beauveria bassiana TaxID=176275 RepID=A0A0A2V774_BEABA|nr:hypothetical protein BBAD15_g11100 [Beauveria bassiana D1-5]PQK11548.1 hypothetical protein BB8028_0003g01730 [Beauveria bassiana]